ncbi:MAG: hypothetical protein Q7R46_01655 [bacterium]|nr:hypothetical protein [bacterium]
MAEIDTIKYLIDGPCPEFIEKGVQKEVHRVIFSRFIITGENGNEPDKKRETIIFGCSFYLACENTRCTFSQASKRARKQPRLNLIRRFFSWFPKVQ